MAFTQTGVPMPALVPDSGPSAPTTAALAAPVQITANASAPAASFSAPLLHVDTAPVQAPVVPMVPLLATPGFDSSGTAVVTPLTAAVAALSAIDSGVAPLSHVATLELPFVIEVGSGDASSDLGGPAPLTIASDAGDGSDASGWFVV